MLIWIGAALSVLGVIGIVASIVMVARAKKAKLDDAEMRARISKNSAGQYGRAFCINDRVDDGYRRHCPRLISAPDKIPHTSALTSDGHADRLTGTA